MLAAAHLPTDGHADPSSLTQALAAGAAGRILRHTPVTALEPEYARGASFLVPRATATSRVVEFAGHPPSHIGWRQ